MTEVPSNHPRYHSLQLRERLVHGLKAGLATEAGLLAHGRGEAFDYLLGEKSHDFAAEAIAVASALLLTARLPVFSVNGNSASLAGQEINELVKVHERMVVEVNLFHHSQQRSSLIANYLRELGVPHVVESSVGPSVALPEIKSARRRMNVEGLAEADVVLVALEDGDRCQALVNAGRKVIAVDLNPLSRTAQVAHVSIVDELTRVLKLLATQLKSDQNQTPEELARRIAAYDNAKILDQAIATIRRGV
jgi:4-phosphopantoate--beta-alanine ligase